MRPRRLANELVVIDRDPGPDERTAAVLGALRVLEALASCGEWWHVGETGRVVDVRVRCESPTCDVCGGSDG